MKNLFLVSVSVFSLTSTFAQTTEDKIEDIELKILTFEQELQKKDNQIAELEREIEIIKEINDDLKKKYKMFQGEQTIITRDVEMKLVSVIGDKSSGSVVVEFLLYNPTKEVISFFTNNFRLVNESGDEVETYSHKIKIGSQGGSTYSLYPNTPIKMFVTFEDVLKTSKYARKINFKHRSDFVSFDGMQIEWR